MNTIECANCDALAKVERGSYTFKECGLSNVVLQGIEVIRCGKCGNEDPIIPRMNDLMRALAVAVINKPYQLQGEDVRFLRKYLGITQDEFSRLVHVGKTHVSKWETGEDPIGDQSDRLIRLLCLSLGEGLREKQEGIKTIKALLNQIQKSKHPQRPHIEVDTAQMSHRYV